MTHESKDWLAADKKGLAQLVAKRGKTFVIGELIQNAWDADGVKEVNVWVEAVAGKPMARVSIEDDAPEGWRDITDAYTLFAPSKKKADPTKRGRFNLGEKLVLAICSEAKIVSVSTGMVFDAKGRRLTKVRRPKGTEFSGLIPMTHLEVKEVQEYVRTLLPPPDIRTTFNGDNLAYRTPLRIITETLPTEIEDEEGNLKPTKRATPVAFYEPLPGEEGTLYEMGIPVVATGDKWHVNIAQKVPLNMDRDNVTPGFLRKIRVMTMNAMADKIQAEDVNDTWVHEATSDPNCAPEAIAVFMDKKFGSKRVAFDPSDQESNKLAVSKGYTVISGNSLSKQQWENAKTAGAVKPAGQVTPSPKVIFSSEGEDVTYPYDKWSLGMKEIVSFCTKLGSALLDKPLSVGVLNSSQGFAACFGSDPSPVMHFNVKRLGKAWFENGTNAKVLELLIHELGHFYSEDHLSKEYHDALCMLGAKCVKLALATPGWFNGIK